MTYKKFSINLPHYLNITVSCCGNQNCLYPQCAHHESKSIIQMKDIRKHCVYLENFALYPIIFSADNKIKCGALKFSDNGKGSIVSDDHNWQFTKYLKGKNYKENNIDLVPVSKGAEIVETTVDVHVPYNGRSKSTKIELQLKVI